MKIGEAVALRVESLCKEHKVTINRLSKMAGMTQSTLSHAVCGERKNPTISTIKKICEGFGITIQEFFDAPYFKDMDAESAEQ